MRGLVRRDESLENDVIHQFPVARLVTQDCQCVIDPVQKQARLPDAEKPVLQLHIAKGHLSVHHAEQDVQILQGLLQFLGNFFWKAFKGPDNIPVVLEHDLCIVIHVAAKLLFGCPRFLVGDTRILYKPSALQQVAQQFVFFGMVLFRQLTTRACLQICHIRYLHRPDPQSHHVAGLRGKTQVLACLE